jgi:hypothetical protein
MLRKNRSKQSAPVYSLLRLFFSPEDVSGTLFFGMSVTRLHGVVSASDPFLFAEGRNISRFNA